MKYLSSQKTVDWALVVFLNFLWATQVPVVRFIGDRLSPIFLAFIPLISSTIIFFPILLLENKKRNVGLKWHWRDIKYFLVSGIIGIFILQYAYTLGSLKTLAANAGIITLTIPVLVAIFASFMLKEKLNIVRVVSFLLAIGGVLLTSVSDLTNADFIHGQYFEGNLIFLFACLCCAFYNTYCKYLVEKKYTELEILVYSSIIGSFASIPLFIWVEPFNLREFLKSGEIAIFGVLELSIFVYGVASLLFFYVLERMDVTQAILGNYLLPFFIGIMGVILLNESITIEMVIGGTIIFLSTLMVTVYENELLSWLRKFRIRKPLPDPVNKQLN